MVIKRETELYAPVKAHFVALGWEVKGEVGAADVMARRGDDVLIVELKLGFSLALLQQAVARQAVTDEVFVAVPRWKGKAGWRTFKGNMGLCKRLGVGVLSVSGGVVQEHSKPAPFRPRKSKMRAAALVAEFDRRIGDPNQGGMTRETIMTGYRQEAQRCAAYLAEQGPSKGADVARAVEAPKATRIMADNHYGWFYRAARGIYALSDAGAAAIADKV